MASLVTLADALITRIATITALKGRVHYWAGPINELDGSVYVAPFVGVVPESSTNLADDSVHQSSVDERLTFEVILVAQDLRGQGINIKEGVAHLVNIRDKIIGYQLHTDASPLKFLGFQHDKEYEYSGATVWRITAECQQVEQ